LQAELRKHVFEVMEEQEKNEMKGDKTMQNDSVVAELLETKEGQMAASLVMDFLKTCQLDHTLTVFKSEANLKDNPRILPKEELASAMGVSDGQDSRPLILSCFEGKGSSEALSKTMSSKALSSQLDKIKDPSDPTESSPSPKRTEKKDTVVVSKPSPLGNLPSLGRSKLGGLPTLKPLGGAGKGLAPIKKSGLKADPIISAAAPAAETQQKPVDNNDTNDFDDDIQDYDDEIPDEDNIDIDDGGDWDAENYQGDEYDLDADTANKSIPIPFCEDAIVEDENEAFNGYHYVERSES